MILRDSKPINHQSCNISIKCAFGEYFRDFFLVAPQIPRRIYLMTCEHGEMEIVWHEIGFSHCWSRSVTSQGVTWSLCPNFAWHLCCGYCISVNTSRTICVNGPFLSYQYVSYYDKSWFTYQIISGIFWWIKNILSAFITWFKAISLTLHTPINIISLICRVSIAEL